MGVQKFTYCRVSLSEVRAAAGRAGDVFSQLWSRVQLVKGDGLLLQLVAESTFTLLRIRFGSC